MSPTQTPGATPDGTPDWTLDWAPLDQELRHWQAAGLKLPLWWRDDDAIEPTPQLDQLSALAQKLTLPVHLAVIPRDAQPALAAYVEAHPEVIPLVHGWAHISRAAPGDKKCEFPPQHPLAGSLAEMAEGLARLEALFGPRLQPIFVPPWNRIAPELLPLMADLGFAAVSRFTPRAQAWAAAGLAQINTHLDPIDWKGSRSLVAPERLINQVSDQLRARRLDQADNREPYGILTHHLVHDAAVWDFTEALITRLMQGPGQIWTFDKKEDER
ncbi:polysaccharide deacetylase family protein [Pseudophaeobacter flagellatus]|uniref:polysaccharide deacetylase family protein n=1 Tax=Pseudophaeobacter flagellatus TaxID=2899119 RepID=UPI001E4A670A|nr:polysaccharide deacetylase family protein [Pseudophaeobacter flagellatus]MCD9149146.1 polysaccharide deacetylase family protein [Pseudophaeobacter flagellatus]